MTVWAPHPDHREAFWSVVPNALLLHAWILLVGFFLIHNLTHAVYSAWERDFPGGLRLIFAVSFITLVWYWLTQECRVHGQRFPLDMGLFLLMAWWFLLPYYLWKSQRWRGLGKIAVLGALWLATYVASWVFSWVLL